MKHTVTCVSIATVVYSNLFLTVPSLPIKIAITVTVVSTVFVNCHMVVTVAMRQEVVLCGENAS